MAREYPDAEVVGVDLAPTPGTLSFDFLVICIPMTSTVDLESIPSNCHFEVDNIELGLNHFQNQFDVVHARLIAAGLKDFKKCKHDIEMCVKPGGIMLWLDGDYDRELFLHHVGRD